MFSGELYLGRPPFLPPTIAVAGHRVRREAADCGTQRRRWRRRQWERGRKLASGGREGAATCGARESGVLGTAGGGSVLHSIASRTARRGTIRYSVSLLSAPLHIVARSSAPRLHPPLQSNYVPLRPNPHSVEKAGKVRSVPTWPCFIRNSAPAFLSRPPSRDHREFSWQPHPSHPPRRTTEREKPDFR